MTISQEILLALESLSLEQKALVVRFCELLLDPAFIEQYEQEVAKHGGTYPFERLEGFMDEWGGRR